MICLLRASHAASDLTSATGATTKVSIPPRYEMLTFLLLTDVFCRCALHKGVYDKRRREEEKREKTEGRAHTGQKQSWVQPPGLSDGPYMHFETLAVPPHWQCSCDLPFCSRTVAHEKPVLEFEFEGDTGQPWRWTCADSRTVVMTLAAARSGYSRAGSQCSTHFQCNLVSGLRFNNGVERTSGKSRGAIGGQYISSLL